MVSQTIVDKLNATCLLLAETLIWQGIDLDADFIESELPGLTFNFAVKLDLWLVPVSTFNFKDLGVESCTFGNHEVPTIERDYFVKLLEESLSFLREETISHLITKTA